jgi:hypothetical protein
MKLGEFLDEFPVVREGEESEELEVILEDEEGIEYTIHSVESNWNDKIVKINIRR